MREFFKKILIEIPEEYMAEFELELLRNNFFRLKYISITMLFFELTLLFFQELLFATGRYVLYFFLFNLIMTPLIWHLYNNIAKYRLVSIIVQYTYVTVALLFGVAITLVSQEKVDLVHMYFMMIFGVSFFVYMRMLSSFVLFFSTFGVFCLFLPFYQSDSNVIFILLINSLAVNVFACMLSGIVLKMKLQMFLDKKHIQGTNIQLREMILRDSMTELYNHETAFSFLKKEIEVAGDEHLLSIIIADIDDFKRINDDYGHLTGDHVIKKVARTIEDSVRSSDRVCRYGGEEFLIIMPNTDLNSALACARRIQAALKNIIFNHGICPTISGGISQYDGGTIDEFLALTDTKLYRAKKAGKDRFFYHNCSL